MSFYFGVYSKVSCVKLHVVLNKTLDETVRVIVTRLYSKGEWIAGMIASILKVVLKEVIHVSIMSSYVNQDWHFVSFVILDQFGRIIILTFAKFIKIFTIYFFDLLDLDGVAQRCKS